MAITLDGTDGVTTTGLTSNGIDDNATSTAITIDSSQNVGIGTAAPESIVHIKDSGNVSTTLQIESAASQYAPVINFDGIVGASADYILGEINGSWDTHTNVVSAIRFESGADTTNKDDGLISFWTSSSGPTLTEAMRIDSSGNVGIGTTTPNKIMLWML
jgi:trimeric autotransporter adhesin